MDTLRLIVRNVFRHRLRAVLTVVGVTVAMLSFCMLRTLVAAWYVGVEASAADRLITRNKISLVHMLPVAHENKIRQVSGVAAVGHGIWYAGIYKERKNFFAQFAISGSSYFDMYPEFLLAPKARKSFDTRRTACVVGRQLAQRFNWRIGDVIPLEGTIFPGRIELVLVGIYSGARRDTDETAMFFQYDYLNEILKQTQPYVANKAGWFVVKIKDAHEAAAVTRRIDSLFRNSLSETLTETEKAFQMGFVAMTEAIVIAIRVISMVVIGIILLVLANTMAMTARERSSEYAVLKTVGFGSRFIFVLIAGESVAIALIGGIAAAILSFPAARIFHGQLGAYFPIFDISSETLGLILGLSLLVGFLAAVGPGIRFGRMSIAEGLRHMG